jgi:hypothetical protein
VGRGLTAKGVCDSLHQIVVKLIDPFKFFETAGWFLGELQAPN